MTLIIFTQQTQQDGEFKVSQKDQKGNSQNNLVQTGVDICFNTAEGYLNIGQICPEKKMHVLNVWCSMKLILNKKTSVPTLQ